MAANPDPEEAPPESLPTPSPTPTEPEGLSGSTDDVAPGLADLATRPYVPTSSDPALDGLADYVTETAPTSLGKYRILGLIGRGGMGLVWKGFDPDLHRTVAIKVLGEHLSHSHTARRRFQREARAAAAINHAHVATVYAVEEHHGVLYMIMEFIDGGSLKEYVASKGKLEPLEVINLGCQIAQGLAAAHAQGVIHRDVKPGNVMLHRGGARARITDFGLARVTSDNVELTSHDQWVGTPAYMAPEVLKGDKVDARSDLFSFGCVMHLMLTGLGPFQGRTPAEMIQHLLNTHPPRLHDIHPAVPIVLSDLVAKLLEKSPDDRYQSAAEVAAILARIQNQVNQSATDEIAGVLAGARAAVGRPAPGTAGRRRWLVVTLLAIVSLAVWMNRDRLMGQRDAAEPQTLLNTAGGGTTPTTVESATVTPLVVKYDRLTVGPGSSADFATIAEAVEHANPGAEITVIGPGPYRGAVTVSGPAANGLRLRASPRAAWQAEAIEQHCSLTLHDAHDVVVSGFDFEVGDSAASVLDLKARAVQVTGDARNVHIEDCSFRHIQDGVKLSLLLITPKPLDLESRIFINRCRFASTPSSLMCLAAGSEVAAARVECTHCRFTGHGTLLYATDGCRQLSLRHNVFAGGSNAINIDLKNWAPDRRVEIVNNTFVESRWWLGLMNSFKTGEKPQGRTDSIIANNLILGGERVQGSQEQWDVALGAWTCTANWFEPQPSTRRDALNSRIVTFHSDIPLPNRDNPDAAAYLVPPSDSPLLTAGTGGSWPSYIGAFAPPAASP